MSNRRYTARVEIYRTEVVEVPSDRHTRGGEVRTTAPQERQTEISKFTIHAETEADLARKIKSMTDIDLTEGK